MSAHLHSFRLSGALLLLAGWSLVSVAVVAGFVFWMCEAREP